MVCFNHLNHFSTRILTIKKVFIRSAHSCFAGHCSVPSLAARASHLSYYYVHRSAGARGGGCFRTRYSLTRPRIAAVLRTVIRPQCESGWSSGAQREASKSVRRKRQRCVEDVFPVIIISAFGFALLAMCFPPTS